MQNHSIISTKINIPRSRADVIIRPRIFEILNEGLRRPSVLTLVSAPAGYGKTTLVVSWLRIIKQKFTWLSLGAEDDNLPRFIAYLFASLQKANPSFGQTAQQTFENFGNDGIQVDAILASLINDLAKVAQPIILVLEDYHFIESPSVHTFVELLIEQVHPQLHVVITTRHDPPVPLVRWRARDQLTEIRTADLQFTLPETTEFLQDVMQLDISNHDIHLLEERTEGWVAGLQLVGLSIRNHKNISLQIGRNNRDVADYLMTEVLNQLSRERRKFLLQTSIVSRLSSSLCNAIIDCSDSQTMLEAFEADNLFLISLDETYEWFRYHHLFTEFLNKRLLAEYPENEVKKLHQHASRWFADNGFIIEAIDHALTAKDLEYAACLIGPQSEKWMQRGEISTILKYLKQIPNDFAWKDWGLCLWYGWVHAVRGDLSPAEHWTNRLEELITPLIHEATQKEDGPVSSVLQNAYVQVLGIRSVIARQNKDFDSAIALGEQALRLIPEGNLHLQTVVSSLLSSAVLESGHFDRAESLLHATRKSAYRTGNSYIAFNLLLNESALAVMRGQLHRAHDLNEEALRLAQTETMERLTFLPQFRLGRLHYFWNELPQAKQYINTALEQADAAKYLNATIRGYITLAWIQNAEGQYQQALQTLEQAEQIAPVQHGLEAIEMVKGVGAQIQFSAGENEAASRWAKSSDWEKIDSAKSRLMLSDESFFPYCQILITSGDSPQLNRAEHLLIWRLADSERQRRESTILKIHLMQALLHRAKNQPDHATASLLQALAIAMPENFVRPFLDEGQPLIPFIKRVPSKHRAKNFAQKICDSVSNVALMDQSLAERLSDQERNILKLMAEGHTNPEIAQARMLAVSTVRWYVKQIFRKLGVHNRTQATTRAQKLNLV